MVTSWQMSCLFWLALSLRALAGPQPPYSWRGIEGQGVFPAKGIVNSFSADAQGQGSNIVWRATLPNWGANAPVVVKDRVFVLCQEGDDIECPQLLCFEVATGKLLWQQSVDHLDAWPAEQQKTAREIRRGEFARWAKFMRWCHRLYWDDEKDDWNKGRAGHSSAKPEEISAETQALLKEAEADGLKMKPYWATGISLDALSRGRFGITESLRPEEVANCKRCIAERIYLYPGWSSEGPFYGSVMGSVVSDGERVYAITALDAAVCYALDGKRLWVTDLASSSKNKGIGCHFGSRFQTNIASPALAGGKLVYYHRDGWTMYGLDCATGQIAWKTPAPLESQVRTDGDKAIAPTYPVPRGYNGHMGPGGTPVVMNLAGTTVVISGHGMIVRVADGKLLGMVEVEAGPAARDVVAGRTAFGGSYNSWVANGEFLYAVSERTTAAFRLRVEKEQVVTDKLWIEKLGNTEAANLGFHANRLYCQIRDTMAGIDPSTGAVKVRGPQAGNWSTGWAITRDGVAVSKSGTGKKDATIRFAICQTPELKVLGQGVLDNTPTAAQRRRNINQLGFPNVNAGPAGVTAWGNRIFYRSNYYLWCIGDPATAYAPPESTASQQVNP